MQSTNKQMQQEDRWLCHDAIVRREPSREARSFAVSTAKI